MGKPATQRTNHEKVALLVLGNQLFDPKYLKDLKISGVFIREDFELCTYFKFHQQKIIFFLAAMRAYSKELEAADLKVTYETLKPSDVAYEKHLLSWLSKNKFEKIIFYEIEDKFFEKRIIAALSSADVSFEILTSPMFLTTREQFKTYLGKSKRPFMKTFYESQRKRLNIMMTPKENQPAVNGALMKKIESHYQKQFIHLKLQRLKNPPL